MTEREVAISEIRHFVIGGHPGEAAIKETGASNKVEYYQGVLERIMDWSGLAPDEVERAIRESPDTIENSNQPNDKPLYLQALSNIQGSQ